MPGTELTLGKSHPLPSAEIKLTNGGSTEKSCTLFDDYKAQPGGQTRVWDEFVPFGDKERSIDLNPGYRGLYIRGGRGGGKSHIGAVMACTRAYFDPKSRGLISANEYGQLESSTLVVLAEVAEQFNIPLYPRGETVEETARMIAARRLCQIFDAQVQVISASKFGGATAKVKQGGRGISCRWAWLDEWAMADPVAMNVLNAALGRGRGSLDGFFWITSTIALNNPYNWCWEQFDNIERSDEKKAFYKSTVLLSSDNKALPSDFVKTLEATYTDQMIAIELMGEYAVTTEGVVFSYFDRAQHVKPQVRDKLYPLHLSFDFNRHPATATVSQNIGDKIHILKEFYLLNSDTFKLAIEVKEWVAAIAPFYFEIHGDSTGSNRSANSTQSNWDIVNNEFHGMNFARRYGKTNPPVIDTINAVNCLLKQNRIEVDSSCKELIKDFEQTKFDKNGGLDKKSDLMRVQVIDSVRYLCHDLYPYESMRSYGAIVGGGFQMPKFDGGGDELKTYNRDVALGRRRM